MQSFFLCVPFTVFLVSSSFFRNGCGFRICSNLNHTVRCEALKAQKEVKEVIPDPDMQIELEDLKQRYKKLKV